ncbi:MAG: hypothetical protein JXA91_05820, partial [Candidatus Thermoplasmatota archaeon]|nr:hypothetical protein [Candidatus Thermoplasmatota archaeon]
VSEEEPGAGNLHAGICGGAVEQSAVTTLTKKCCPFKRGKGFKEIIKIHNENMFRFYLKYR